MQKMLLSFLLLCFAAVIQAKDNDLKFFVQVEENFTQGLRVSVLLDGVLKESRFVEAGQEIESVIRTDFPPPRIVKIIAVPADGSPADNCGDREYFYSTTEGAVSGVGVAGMGSDETKFCLFVMERSSKKGEKS